MSTDGKDLRNHLNELWRTTVDQFDEIKDVIIRNSHVGRKKLDATFLKRQRDRLFQDLGEAVFDQVEAGTLQLAPEGQRSVERLREVLEQLVAEEAEIDRMSVPADPVVDDEPTVETAAIRSDEAAEVQPEAVVTPEPEPEPAADVVEAAAEAAAEPEPEPEPEPEVEAKPARKPRSRPRSRAKSPKKDVDAAASSSDKDGPAEDATPAKPRRRRRRRTTKKEDAKGE